MAREVPNSVSEREIDHRFNFHPATHEAVQRDHEFVRTKMRITTQLVNQVIPAGREASLFITKMEEAMFWANAAIARNHDIVILESGE